MRPAPHPARVAIRLALIAGLALAAPAPLRAQTDSLEQTRRQEREQLELEAQKKRELEDIERRARESKGQAKELLAQENRVLRQLRAVQRDLALTRRRLGRLESRRKSLDRELGVTEVTLERSIASLQEQRARLARRLRRMYMLGSSRELEFLLSGRSFAGLMARWDFLVLVARQDRSLLEGIQNRKEQVEAAKQRIEGNLTALQKNQQQTTRENQRLGNLRSQRETSMNQIRTQRKAYEAAANELERTASSIRRLLAQLEARRKAEAGRVPQPYTGAFARGQGALDWPVSGRVVGQFGLERHPRFGTTTQNNGIDIQATTGTPVRAVAKGRVDFTNDDFGSFGQVIVLNHGDGFYTLYGHLSEIGVSNGQEVQSGQTIGRVGDSGTSLKGTVLHFEVRKGGTALNPQDWLK